MNLLVRTKEGISVKNLRHFPSSEWGDNGGTSAQVYYKGMYVADFIDYGDGGMPTLTYDESVKNTDVIDTDCITALKRLDPSLKKYDFLWKKNKANAEDWGMLIAFLECVTSKIAKAI